jgi:phosphatidylglycerophosphatase A
MSDLALSWTSATISIAGIVVAAFAFFRWSRGRTNRALGEAFGFLAIGVNAGAMATLSSGALSHWAVGLLLALNVVLFGIALYFIFSKGNASPTA